MGETHGKSSNGIISIERSGNEVVALDVEGRILYFTDGDSTWKRSLGNIYIRIGWEGSKRIIEYADKSESANITGKAYGFLREVKDDLEDAEISSSLEQILTKPDDWLEEDGKLFAKEYESSFPLIPQDQRFSAYFQLTGSSTWNCATFVNPAESVGMKDSSEFDSHVDRVKKLFGSGFELRRGAFLGDAYALSAEQKPLLSALDTVKARTGLPVYAFVDTFSIPRKKNMIHYQDMKRHGLSRVYVGIQSGSVSLLRHFEKLKNVSDILNLVNNLKNSGISVGLILLTGYGGKQHSREHVAETAMILSQLDLDEGDIIYISPMSEKEDPRYMALVENETFDIMSEEEKLEQADELEKKVREEFRGSNRFDLKTQISRFDIREGIY